MRIPCFQKKKTLGLDHLFQGTRFKWSHCKFAAWVLACNLINLTFP